MSSKLDLCITATEADSGEFSLLVKKHNVVELSRLRERVSGVGVRDRERLEIVIDGSISS